MENLRWKTPTSAKDITNIITFGFEEDAKKSFTSELESRIKKIDSFWQNVYSVPAMKCIERLSDTEIDFMTPGIRGLGRLSTAWPRFGGNYRKQLKNLPQKDFDLLHCYIYCSIRGGYDAMVFLESISDDFKKIKNSNFEELYDILDKQVFTCISYYLYSGIKQIGLKIPKDYQFFNITQGYMYCGVWLRLLEIVTETKQKSSRNELLNNTGKKVQALMFKDIKKEIKDDQSKIWKEFKGNSNSKEVLEEKAKTIAPHLCSLSNDFTNNLIKTIELKTNLGKMIFYETITFCIHMIDRSAFGILGDNLRNDFCTSLIDETMALAFLNYFQLKGKNVEDETNSFLDFYNNRQNEYSNYAKLFPDKNESPENTLIWEASKKIAEDCGYKMDIRYITIANVGLCEIMKSLIDLIAILKV
jgi:hypothetical protein